MATDRELVLSKAHVIFAERAADIMLLLDDVTDSPRVHLAILKLASADPAKLQYFIDCARTDSRDVLAWAEYPEEFRSPTWKMENSVVKELRSRDRQQYEQWLNGQDDPLSRE